VFDCTIGSTHSPLGVGMRWAWLAEEQRRSRSCSSRRSMAVPELDPASARNKRPEYERPEKKPTAHEQETAANHGRTIDVMRPRNKCARSVVPCQYERGTGRPGLLAGREARRPPLPRSKLAAAATMGSCSPWLRALAAPWNLNLDSSSKDDGMMEGAEENLDYLATS
jgi:hypothetical protein